MELHPRSCTRIPKRKNLKKRHVIYLFAIHLLHVWRSVRTHYRQEVLVARSRVLTPWRGSRKHSNVSDTRISCCKNERAGKWEEGWSWIKRVQYRKLEKSSRKLGHCSKGVGDDGKGRRNQRKAMKTHGLAAKIGYLFERHRYSKCRRFTRQKKWLMRNFVGKM